MKRAIQYDAFSTQQRPEIQAAARLPVDAGRSKPDESGMTSKGRLDRDQVQTHPSVPVSLSNRKGQQSPRIHVSHFHHFPMCPTSTTFTTRMARGRESLNIFEYAKPDMSILINFEK